MNRFDEVIARIDAANAEDPYRIRFGAIDHPSERLYSERMTATLTRLQPDASEALRIAARAQHLCRWKVPRSTYPMDRAGYHRWRGDLKRKHAEWTAEFMTAAGYSAPEIEHVARLIRKENLKTDSEAQTLEDIACLVFLEHYAAPFAEKHDEAKVLSILQKTWAKMSPRGHAAALGLALPEPMASLVRRAISSGPLAKIAAARDQT